MAYAMNYDVYKSMDALEAAVRSEPDHFWAQLKYAELHYRLRALLKAERRRSRPWSSPAIPWELSVARKQLQEIRRLNRESTRNFEWHGLARAGRRSSSRAMAAAMVRGVRVAMNWKLFVGASILAVGLMLKIGAPLFTIVLGVALAALLSWLTRRPSTKSR